MARICFKRNGIFLKNEVVVPSKTDFCMVVKESNLNVINSFLILTHLTKR